MVFSGSEMNEVPVSGSITVSSSSNGSLPKETAVQSKYHVFFGSSVSCHWMGPFEYLCRS